MSRSLFNFSLSLSREYPAKNMIDTEYVYYLALLVDTSAKAEYQPHRLDQAVRDSGLYVNEKEKGYKTNPFPL